jgi:hypothetical protein
VTFGAAKTLANQTVSIDVTDLLPLPSGDGVDAGDTDSGWFDAGDSGFGDDDAAPG